MKRKITFMLIGISLSVIGSSAFLMSPSDALPGTARNLSSDQSMISLSLNQLANTEWLLEDLGGTGVVDRVQTTLRFNGSDRINGQGGCNTYSAQIQSKGDRVTVSPVVSTRKACVPAVMDQETRYFQAIQNATQIRLSGAYLLIDSEGLTAPLRFTRLTPGNTASNTVIAVQGRRNAARIFRQQGQLRMNVYDKQDRSTWLRGVPVVTQQTPDGTQYSNQYGEVQVVVSVPAAGETPTLTINGKLDR